jgi:hypothetical protein
MKNLLTLFLLLLFGQAFSQIKPNDTILYELDNKFDSVIYRTHNGTREISGFNILIGKRKVYFSTAVNSNFKLKNKKLANSKNNIQLEQIITNDSPEKQYLFLILYKNRYYRADYLIRTLKCN